MLWQCLQSQISRHLEFCMNLQAFQQQQLFSSFVPLVDFLMLLPTSSRCSSLSPLSDEPLMDIQFSLGLGHPEIPKATHCMLTELTDYSTFSQTPSSLHTTRNTESSFKLSSTGFGTVKLLQWQHTPMQLYFKKSVHWNRSTQACTHLVPEVHSDGNPAIQERLNVVPPAQGQQEKESETIATAYRQVFGKLCVFKLHWTILALYIHHKDHRTFDEVSLFKYRSFSCIC